MNFIQCVSAIGRDWKNISPYAKPYYEAMCTMENENSSYMFDSGKSIILYFLSNASSWKGEVAKEVKNSLKKLSK